jgi:protein dithiol oxidoreductase (disulfide-forming)
MTRGASVRSTFLALAAIGILGCGSGDPQLNEAVDSQAPGAGSLEAPEDAALRAPQDDETATASGRFQLGTHYERLSPTQPTSSSPGQVEVAEVFWYGCPHCAAFEPYLKSWEAQKADYVNFVRIPAVWNPLVQLHARAFYTAEALDKVEAMHSAFFTEIHDNGNFLDSKEALAEFFGRFGVDAETFEETFESFAVHTKLQRADELSRRYRITSVPAIVVNGKYTTNASMAGGYDQLMVLIDELAASERPED